MLSTMVLMGMNRITVTGGKLRATMAFHIDTSDFAREEQATDLDIRHGGSGAIEHGLVVGVGVGVVRLRLLHAQPVRERDERRGRPHERGRDPLPKSDTFPLERMAPPSQLGTDRGQHRRPGGQRADRRPAASRSRGAAHVKRAAGAGTHRAGVAAAAGAASCPAPLTPAAAARSPPERPEAEGRGGGREGSRGRRQGAADKAAAEKARPRSPPRTPPQVRRRRTMTERRSPLAGPYAARVGAGAMPSAPPSPSSSRRRSDALLSSSAAWHELSAAASARSCAQPEQDRRLLRGAGAGGLRAVRAARADADAAHARSSSAAAAAPRTRRRNPPPPPRGGVRAARGQPGRRG